MLRSPTSRFLQGNCLDVLPTLNDGSVHCCITSPPYWGLRDYRVDGQFGSEKTLDEYIGRLVDVFRQVQRVLRDDGTLWLNLGDSFINKCLLGLPWRVAFALMEDGWVLRNEIIWHKPDPMPECCNDRFSRSHEQLFLFSKRTKYFMDQWAVHEVAKSAGQVRVTTEKGFGCQAAGTGRKPSGNQIIGSVVVVGEFANKRDVWTVSNSSESGAHFAVFPPKLVYPCIKAGTSYMGCCSVCGAPLVRVLTSIRRPTRPGLRTKVKGFVSEEGNRDPLRHVSSKRTTGWRRTCDCEDATEVPCCVLDPFAGSFTTVAEAARLGRDGIGIELNPDYIELGKRKVRRFLAKRGFGLG
jgi:site-specific DNA-methyltransferase (adenine-specific)